ncbi:MAG: aminotransferase class I/II-fold pyridoxal phosphate-dependent enzyme, partial [Halothiobacillaceae bacterium]
AGAEQLGLRLMPSDTPIQPILVGDAGEALGLSQRLLDASIQVTAIRPPTVPQGTARLRVTFSASHSLQDVDRLLTALERLGSTS